jgi:hypothetical protein
MGIPALESAAISLFICMAALSSLGACSTLRNQFDASNVNGCIKKNCSESDARGYQDCEAACRRNYGR